MLRATCSLKGALILYTQYDVDDWYCRIDCVRAGAKRTPSLNASWVCFLMQ